MVNFVALHTETEPKDLDYLFEKVRFLFARNGISKPQKLKNIVLENRLIQPDPQAIYEFDLGNNVSVKVEDQFNNYKTILFSSMVRPFSADSNEEAPRVIQISGTQ